MLKKESYLIFCVLTVEKQQQQICLLVAEVMSMHSYICHDLEKRGA